MNNRFDRAVEEVRNIKMTSDEKQAIFNRIAKVAPVKSPWSMQSLAFFAAKNRLAVTIGLLLCICLPGAGVAFAAQGALPGDALYGIKVGIEEPLKVFFAGGALARAKVQADLVDERLGEVDALVAEGKLDPEKESSINSLIDAHVSALSGSLKQVRKEDASGQADNIAVSVIAALNAHSNVLDAFNGDPGQSGQHTADTANQERKQAVVLRKVDGVPEATSTESLATSSLPFTGRFIDKKASVESLIEHADSEVSHAIASSSTGFQSSLSKSARAAVERAQDSLHRAEVQNKEGQSDKAYESLLDSQSAAQEAHLIIENGPHFKNSKRK